VNSGGWGAPPSFDDNPLVIGQTPIRSAHITQLRTAIDAVRSHFNLGNYPWQAPAASGDPISIAPIQEMRTALDQALGAGSYAGGLASGQPILKIHIQELRDRILAAWQSGGGSLDLRWLVADQLGTPRMIFDQSGSLASVSRHDYLPFGEELPWQGGRTPQLGYVGDSTRQKFTQKERDIETGLDYFLARYYSSTQGRFTSPDEFRGGPTELFMFAQAASANPTFYADLRSPQSLNKYQYCLNNPLRFIDPDGHRIRFMDDQSDADRKELRGRVLFNLNRKERQYFTIAYDKTTKQYTLSIKGNVDKALTQSHTKAFEYLVQTIKHPDTVRVGFAEKFTTKEGADSTYGTGATIDRPHSLSGDVEVYLSRQGKGIQGREVIVEGLKGEDLAAPRSIIAGHELFGHALQEMLSPTGADPGEQKAIEIENDLRRGRGLPLRLH